MIEFLLGRFPANEIEVLSIVFEVATDTVFAIRVLHLHVEVVAVLVGKSFSNFLVTIEAFESWSAGTEDMARIALGGSGKGRMSFGEGAGGNLCGRRSGK